MNGGVDHECSSVQQSCFAPVDDLAFFVDEDEVGGFDEREGYAERVDPESRWIYRVLRSGTINMQLPKAFRHLLNSP